MFEYSICNNADTDIFKKQCKALESNIPEIVKKDLLDDVDGSQTQIYSVNGKNIEVHNSLYIDAVYVTSEVELTQFFK